MGSPTDDPSARVDLGKDDGVPIADGAGEPEAPFDPYRFGAPDVPPPPEYAPPGYRPPPGYQYPGPQQTGAQQTGGQQSGPQPQTAYPPYPPYPYGTTQHPSPYGPPPGYGPPPYGGSPYGQGAPSGQGNGKALAALILGIASIVLFWTTIFDAVLVILAVVFGCLGLGDARLRHGRGRGQALAGLICAAVGAVLAVATLVVLVHVANKCGGFGNQDDPGFRQCIRDKI